MGIFEGNKVATARGTEGGIFFLPGTYFLEVTRCKEGVNQHGKEYFVAEFKILESDNPERKVGTPCSFMVTWDKYPDLSYGNMADFLRCALVSKLVAATGVPYPVEKISEYPLTDAIGKGCTGEKNELVGVKVRTFVFNKKTKANTDFTRHNWYLPSAVIGDAVKQAAASAA